MSNFIASFKNYIAFAIIYLFNCLPIKNNKIFCFSYYGTQYGCNPKYITEYILKNYPKDRFDVVWAFNDTNKPHLTGIRKVKTMSLRYFYEICTSKVIITNFRTTELFVKRKSQFYIQTWHSSLRLKQIEKDAEGSLPQDYVEMAKKDSQKCDLLLSGCVFSTNIFKRAFWYDGNIFEHGTPRNDILFQNDSVMRKKILKLINIPIDSKVVLYAPTFRKDNNLEVYNIDYQLVSEKLREKFGGNWTFLVKLHPHLAAKSNQLMKGKNIIDVTSFDDTQELLSITDILISDYSSLMFDFGITKRPCFLYVPDLLDYTNNDRNLYFDSKELPFISANSNDELIEKIDSFNQQEYNDNLIRFLDSIGSFEDGNACENLLQQINEICFSRNRKGNSYGTEAV
ncbi:CDP-glycerol glycerophosphotransferase family protein [Neobacillus vireti]|uniref:Glycero-phosphotransferase n=1 Tax=Neobacillus vireti LMG 21834 TaxID=1131730 RepID=A0AB94IKJ8_9BACI|nr:CDP-glycerol glycerophosphotransferase family protein [Neobacillus vireti]ETI67558.1 glycero-phosphotransferase [Neobacillus vireti LMG 21834]KLT18491.1 glycerophosphotransferase [Neobacillus vireti]